MKNSPKEWTAFFLKIDKKCAKNGPIRVTFPSFDLSKILHLVWKTMKTKGKMKNPRNTTEKFKRFFLNEPSAP